MKSRGSQKAGPQLIVITSTSRSEFSGTWVANREFMFEFSSCYLIFLVYLDLPWMLWPETWYNTNRHSSWPLDTSSLRTSKWACPLVSVFSLSKISTENNEALQREEKLRGPRICKRVRRISVIQDEDNWFKLSHRYIYSRSVIKKQLIQNWILIVLQRR